MYAEDTRVIHYNAMQEQDDAAEHAGPLAEIEFWRSRTVDLGGIRDQLDDKSGSLHSAVCTLIQMAEAMKC